ncbi:MAG: HD domain-containing protein [Coriobacteriia bacterium]|nr:HD domain-containing protein [Coriobacteriia bacterium]
MPEPLRILMIEDSQADASLIDRELRRHGREIETAVVSDAAGLQSQLERTTWDIVLSDYALPGFGAVEAFEMARKSQPLVPFVVVSGTLGEERAVELMRSGVTDYVSKDTLDRLWGVVERAVREAGERKALVEAQHGLVVAGQEWHDTFDALSDGILILNPDCRIHRINRAASKTFGMAVDAIVGKHISAMFNALCPGQAEVPEQDCVCAAREFELGPCCDGDARWFDVSIDPVHPAGGELEGFVVVLADITARRNSAEQLKALVEQLERSMRGSVSIAAHMVEKRDPYTAGHQEGVAEVAVRISEKLGLSPERVEMIHTASVLHDIGKIAVPAEILVKPGKLDEYEWLIMQRHPQVGAEILEDAELGGPIAEIVRQHHERLDGSGYPSGLRGSEICLEARIIGVADVTEAMLAHRPYRPALTVEQTVEELSDGRGVRYDADVVDACLATLPR